MADESLARSNLRPSADPQRPAPPQNQAETLAWRIPDHFAQDQLRFERLRIGVATVGFLILAIFTGPALGVAMWIGIGAVAALVAYGAIWLRIRAKQQEPDQPNVWLGPEGLAYQDAHCARRALDLREAQSFFIGPHDQISSGELALVIDFSDGFQSQPITIFPPATRTLVEEILQNTWNLPSRERPIPVVVANLRVRSDLLESRRKWNLVGTGPSIRRLATTIREFASATSAPPTACQPKRMGLDFGASGIELVVDHGCWIYDFTISGTPIFLSKLADELDASVTRATISRNLSEQGPDRGTDDSFELRFDDGHLWRIGVRVEADE